MRIGLTTLLSLSLSLSVCLFFFCFPQKTHFGLALEWEGKGKNLRWEAEFQSFGQGDRAWAEQGPARRVDWWPLSFWLGPARRSHPFDSTTIRCGPSTVLLEPDLEIPRKLKTTVSQKSIAYLHECSLDLSVCRRSLRKSSAANGVDFVHENDARLMVPRVAEHFSHHTRTLAYVLVNDGTWYHCENEILAYVIQYWPEKATK